MNKGNAFVLDRNRDRSTLPAIQEWGWIGDSGFRAVFPAREFAADGLYGNFRYIVYKTPRFWRFDKMYILENYVKKT